MHVAVGVDLFGFKALLQADSIIPFVAEDNAIPDREEVLGDGTLQTAVQQHEAAFANVMANISTPGTSFEAPGLEAAHDTLLAEMNNLRQELCGSRRKLEDRRQHMTEILPQEQHIRNLQKEFSA